MVAEEPPRSILPSEAGRYYEEFSNLSVALAHCTLCKAQYLAWFNYNGVRTPGDGRIVDLSYRSTFNDEPSESDLPPCDPALVYPQEAFAKLLYQADTKGHPGCDAWDTCPYLTIVRYRELAVRIINETRGNGRLRKMIRGLFHEESEHGDSPAPEVKVLNDKDRLYELFLDVTDLPVIETIKNLRWAYALPLKEASARHKRLLEAGARGGVLEVCHGLEEAEKRQDFMREHKLYPSIRPV